MQIKIFINSIFNSNTYILYKNQEIGIWIIDPGNCTPKLIEWLENSRKKLLGIFLTHTHFDHIYGLNDLMKEYPDISVYASVFAKEGMMSEKLNGSYYQEIPFTIQQPEFTILKENDSVQLWKDITLNVIETPGHDRDCLSFQIGKYLFTGDALIPGIKVFTKLKYSNKIDAENSIKRILSHFETDTIIYPGHGHIEILANVIKDY